MALKDLVARLEADARARVDGIRDQAELEVRALEARTVAALTQDAARRLADRRAERRRALERQLSEVRQRTRAEALTARWALLERLFTRAGELVHEEGATAAYRDALPRHLDEALAYLETLGPLVRCHPDAAALLETHLAGRDDVTVLADPSMGPGVIATAADGSAEVDNTLAARLERLKPALAVALLEEVARARP